MNVMVEEITEVIPVIPNVHLYWTGPRLTDMHKDSVIIRSWWSSCKTAVLTVAPKTIWVISLILITCNVTYDII